MYTKLTIRKAAGDEVHAIADEGEGPQAQLCASLFQRAELTVGMHNGQELDKQAASPGYIPDLWTVETDEATP